MLKNINMAVPERLLRKVEAFTAEINLALDAPMTARELMLLAIAEMVNGEHLLEEYYENKNKKPPRKVQKVIQVGKGYMDTLLEKSINKANIGK